MTVQEYIQSTLGIYMGENPIPHPPSLPPSLPRTHLHHVQRVQGEILLEAGGGRHLTGLHLHGGREGGGEMGERCSQSWPHWKERVKGGGGG